MTEELKNELSEETEENKTNTEIDFEKKFNELSEEFEKLKNENENLKKEFDKAFRAPSQNKKSDLDTKIEAAQKYFKNKF